MMTGEDMYFNISTSPSIAYYDLSFIADFFHYSNTTKNVVPLGGALRFWAQTYNTSVYKGETQTQLVQA